MRVTSCAGKCSKVLLLLINIVVFLAGGGLLGVGIYYHLDGGLYEYVFKEADVITIPVVMMFLGCLFILISFFAIVGALCEVKFMLKIYMGIVAIVLLLEVILMAVCIAMRGEVEKRAIAVIHNVMEHYGNEETDDLNVITKVIDETHQWLQCCGLDGPADWASPDKAKYWAATYNPNTPTDPTQLPLSCCTGSDVTTCTLTSDTSTFHTAGCKEGLYNFIEQNITYISVCGIVMILLQIFILISALKIRFELSSKYECDDYYNGEDMEMTSL